MTLLQEFESLGYHLLQHPGVGLRRFFLRDDVLAIIVRYEANPGMCERCKAEIRADNPAPNEPPSDEIKIDFTGIARARQEAFDRLAATKREPLPSEERPARENLMRLASEIGNTVILRNNGEIDSSAMGGFGFPVGFAALVESIDANTTAIREAKR